MTLATCAGVGFNVRMADALPVAVAALIVISVLVLAIQVFTANVADLAPAGTVTVAGREARRTSLAFKFTVNPSDGAADESWRVAVVLFPLVTVAGLSVTA